MNPETLNFLKQMKDSMQADLNNYEALMREKKKDFLRVEMMLQQFDTDLDDMEKQVIDCVNIEEE